MNENGFYSDRVEQPCIFYDEKEEPKAKVYVKKYGIEKKCKFYLTDDNEGRTNIKDVTDQTELIYEKLARPLQDLENLEYSDGNTI